MQSLILMAFAFSLCVIAYKKVNQRFARESVLPGNSLPQHYGWLAVCLIAISFAVFGIALLASGKAINNHVKMLVVAVITLLAFGFSIMLISKKIAARKSLERIANIFLKGATAITIAVTLAIVVSVLYESFRFFSKIPFFDFLFGLHWSPQTAMRADQAGSSGSFGFIPVFLGTVLITLIAILIAAPIGILSAIYLSEYSSRKFRNSVKPILEILAGVPTVVYGYFAAVNFGPALKNLGDSMGIAIASESALAAGVVMGIMIIPFIMSISDDVMNAVPNSLRDGSLAVGATKSETITKVIIPAALPGIMGALLLGISRGIGETMIVVMAAGLIAKLTFNPLDAVTTVTAQIVTLLVGDQEFDSPKTLAAFALGLTLFFITLALNVVAVVIVKKYREKYE